MNKTRKNIRSVNGGGNNNWRPTRSKLMRPLYANNQRNLQKVYRNIEEHNKVDLSKYQKALITGTDSQRKDAIRDLKYIKKFMTQWKRSLIISKPVAVTVLVILAPIGYATGQILAATALVQDTIHALRTDTKMEYDELMKTINTLLESSNIEELTSNPLLHIKNSKKNMNNVNVVERNGELFIKPANNSNINNEENNSNVNNEENNSNVNNEENNSNLHKENFYGVREYLLGKYMKSEGYSNFNNEENNSNIRKKVIRKYIDSKKYRKYLAKESSNFLIKYINSKEFREYLSR